MLNKYNWYNKIKDKRIVLLQSGGLDSNIVAALLSYYHFSIQHLFIDYGQNMLEQERKNARLIVKHYGGKLTETKIDLPWLKEATNLVDNVVNDEGAIGKFNTYDVGTYVPLRNHVLLSIAGSLAEAYKIPNIACAFDGCQNILGKPTGGTTDKHPKFIHRIEQSINEGSAMYHIEHKPIQILTPIMNFYKTDTIQLGLELNADMSISWSCYNKGDKPCGHCSACEDREEAFRVLGIDDPALSEK
jgi:7-cyano-7-deazaguanine synthase